MQSTSDLRLSRTTFANGERYPILLNSVGCPEWYPTLFATVRYRNTSKAFNTAYAALSAIRQVCRWARSQDIDLADRFRKRQVLLTREIESLADFLTCRHVEVLAEGRVVAMRRGKLEGARMAAPKEAAMVSPGFAYSRLSYAAEYLQWFAFRVLEDAANEVDKPTSERIAQMAGNLRARRPAAGRKTRLKAKKAQSAEERNALMALSQPDSSDNPFSTATARRNLLIVMLLDELGIRVGELLAIKVTDIDLQAQEMVIPRRHNDPEDPRPIQPVAKTIDRRLALSDELTLIISSYILKERRTYPAARRHPFLLVSSRGSRAGKAGHPLSRQAVWKLIFTLSGEMPDGSRRVHPHLLRHNAVSRLYGHLSAQGASEPLMEQLLSWKFGWEEGSGTARTYIESEVERQAIKAQRDLQKKWRNSQRV